MHGVGGALAQRVLAEAGRPFVILLKLTRRRYERATRRAFAFA
jgi:hypothetical protein